MSIASTYRNMSLSADQPDAWTGSITLMQFVPRGPIAFEIEGLLVRANVTQVERSDDAGVSTYALTLELSRGPDGLPLETTLDRIIGEIHPPDDPLDVLDAANACLAEGESPAYLSSSALASQRASVGRPTASNYFQRVAASLGITLVIESDVIGAQSRLPFASVWTGAGKSLRAAIEEVLGFGKPLVRVNADGWVIVGRTPTPTAFSGMLSSPAPLVMRDTNTDTPTVDATWYAIPKEVVCANEGG